MFSSEESSLSFTSLQAKSGISNLLKKLRNHFSKDANDPQLRRYWMPDSNSKECYDCGEKFTALRRRHHCRVCGQIFCNKCCKEDIPGNLVGYSSNCNVRVCNYCYQIVSSFTKNEFGAKGGISSPLSDDSIVPFESSYKTIPRPSLSCSVPHVATLKDLFIGASTSTANSSGGPPNGDTGRRMSAVERRITSYEDGALHPPGIRSAASSPLFSFKRRGSLFPEEDVLSNSNTGTCSRSTDQYRSASVSPYKTSSTDDASYSLNPANKTDESDKKKGRKRQDSLGSQDEGSHEPLWVKEINPNEAGDDKSIGAYSPSIEIFEGPNDEYQTREIYFKSKKPVRCERHYSRDTVASAFEIEFDLENELVSAYKPIKKEKLFVNTGPDEKDAGEVKSVDELVNEELVAYYKQKSLPEGVKSTFDPVIDQKLDELFDKNCKKLATQLLNDENIPLTWINPLKNLSHKVAVTVSPISLTESDGIDIRQYVKIKRMVGAGKGDYLIINGLVFTKHVTHRKMRQNISNPKILLLSCPIVYNQRMEQKLTSLESINLQEHSYLKNLVSKIFSYSPDIVVVDKTVARTAQEMILELGLTLVCNVKSKILEKLSRFTGAAIVSSLDAQIGCPELGTCNRFYVQTFNGTKTLMFFDGCSPNLGCSVVLRGSSSLDELEKLKDIAYFMIFCQYNWRLEKALLMDCFASPSINSEIETSQKQDIEVASSDSINLNRPQSESREHRVESIRIEDGSDPLQSMAAMIDKTSSSFSLVSPISTKDPPSRSSPQLDLTSKVSQLLEESILTCSPLIKFDLPYLVSEESRDNQLKRYINLEEMFWSKKIRLKAPKDLARNTLQVDQETTSPKDTSSPSNTKSRFPPHPFILRDLKFKFNSNEAYNLLADFRAQGSRIPKTKILTFNNEDLDQPVLDEDDLSIDALDPKFHQRLAVLYSSFSQVTSVSSPFCVDPYIVMMEYYSCFDISLGAFLEKYCFSTSYSCPVQGCSTSMLNHTRKFVHGKGCVQITLKEVKATLEPAQNNIVTWSWCQKCQTSSPLAVLSTESACLSFGKFLELRFYGDKYRRREYGSYPGCQHHSLFTDHNQYFVYKNILTSFKYESINVYEVTLPLPRIQMRPDLGWRCERTSSFSDSFSSPKERIEVIINEEDPGSIIAYAMTTGDYDKQLMDIMRGTASPSIKKKFLISVESNASSIVSQAKESQLDLSATSSAVSFTSKATSNTSSAVSPHIDIQFNDSTTKYYCCIYFAEQFKNLRSELIEMQWASSSNLQPSDYSTPTSSSHHSSTAKTSGILASNESVEESFIRSISCCIPWTASGGKSGATFCKTSDDRFILKEMSRPELHSFLKIAKFYFDYVLSALNEVRPTLLAKIFGVYKISFKNSSTNNASKMYLLVMENLFYQRNISLKFDLKGSDRNRWVRTDDPNNVVLLDENLIRSIRESPFYIRHHAKKILSTAIDNDSLFLSSHSVMDYSLLVGVDEEHQQFVVGIIDYIRPYTWDKRLEMVVKSVGSHGKMPTIISPDLYRERFCDKMNQYFLCVPDRWYGFEAADKPINGVKVYS